MNQYSSILKYISEGQKCLAILIDPDKFIVSETDSFLKRIPKDVTYLFVGGSSVTNGHTESTVAALKAGSRLPIILFPGDHSQITTKADALLFLSLISGRNAEYLIGQQVKSVEKLKDSDLEVIPTGYVLIDGGNESAVARVSNTIPISQGDRDNILHTALAGQYMGAKLIYLEAGSGAEFPVRPEIISEVKKAISVPLIVGGGIRTDQQKREAYLAGADMVVMGTAYEK